MPKIRSCEASLEKIANVEDEATGRAYESFDFEKPLGRRGQEIIPRERAVDANKLKETLVSKNWIAASNKRESLVAAAIKAKPYSYWLLAARIGWTASGKQFVLHDHVVGEISGALVTKPPMWVDKLDNQLRIRGDLKTWMSEVAKPARYSTRLLMLMSCTFAAPLLKMVELQSFAVLLFGSSKTGKTTALLAASSIMGIGRESDLSNFNVTDAGLLERARSFNDLTMPGNELGLMKGAKKEAYHRIRTLLYLYSEGTDTARHTQSPFSTDGGLGKWRGIFLPNSEHSFDALAALAGMQRDAGEYARCMDVPALAPNMQTIFDRKPAHVDEKKFAAWSKDSLVKLRKACAENYGCALDAYLEHLIGLDGQCRQRVLEHMAEFDSSLGDISSLDGASVHAAKNFSLIYAGGRLAIDAGVVPWKATRLLSAIIECFRATLSASEKPKTLLEIVLPVLKCKIEEQGIRKKANSGVNPKYRDGYYERTNGKAKVYTIKATAMREWFTGPGQLNIVIDWLEQRKLLRSSQTKPMGQSKALGWAITSPRWRRDTKVKSFKFVDPF